MADDFVLRTAVAAACGVALLIPVALRPAAGSPVAPRPVLYATAQAATGKLAYAANCAQCHGAQLQGGVAPALRGPTLVRLAKKTKLTIGDFFQFTALQMPLDAPASLSKSTYAAVMAYILARNGFPAGSKPLTYDAAMNSNMVITTYPDR